MNERLKLIRTTFKLNQEDFGKKIGLTQSALTLMENGKRVIRDVYIAQICQLFNINENWFRTGEGDMLSQAETFSLDEEAKKSNLTDLEVAIMRGYMELDRDVREAIVSKLEGKIEDIIQQRMQTNEMAATVEKTPEQIADEEAENYRLEVLAELKGETLSASAKPNGKLG